MKGIIALVVFSFFAAIPAFAASGATLLQEKCVSCHNVSGPAATTVEEVIARKGPDLFYAGVKYNADWLEGWLQKPERLRPAGYLFFNYLEPNPNPAKPDLVKKEMLPKHPALNAKDAKAVTVALMKLRANEDLVVKGSVTDAPVSMMMGEMNFDKFSGCLACHEIEPGFGGGTGPEVYTIGKRLQKDYIYSYLKNPEKWSPKTWMPNKQLGENFLQVLTKYMIKLGEGK